MSENNSLSLSLPSIEPVRQRRKVRVRTLSRKLNPWFWFGWLRRRATTSGKRDFYSHKEKQAYSVDKMTQRASSHHYGVKL